MKAVSFLINSIEFSGSSWLVSLFVI